MKDFLLVMVIIVSWGSLWLFRGIQIGESNNLNHSENKCDIRNIGIYER